MEIREICITEIADKRMLVYSGRLEGERCRDTITALDSENCNYTIEIPDNVMGLTCSFFLGAFGPTIRKHGSIDAFSKKFKFTGNEAIVKEINESFIAAALKTSWPI